LPALSCLSVAAHADGFEAGSILVHGSALIVVPTDSTNDINLNNSNIGGRVTADNVITPELDVSYFFTPNLAIQAIAATTRNNVVAKNTGAGTLELGTTRILPPTISAQWHFNPTGTIVPYLGAGVNYTIFYDTLGSSALGSHNFVLDNTFGYAFEAGFDYKIEGKWYANVDVKKLFITTNAHFLGEAVKSQVALDPWLVGVGIGYRF
jgi:outer membrane protein